MTSDDVERLRRQVHRPTAASDLVAGRVREVRRERHYSAKDLADRCATVGAEYLTVSVLANIETGRPDRLGHRRRDITIEELYALAYALDVPPICLLVPAAPGSPPRKVSVTAQHTAEPAALHAWVRGDAPLSGTDQPAYLAASRSQAAAYGAGPETSETVREMVQSELRRTIGQLLTEAQSTAPAPDDAALLDRVEGALAAGQPTEHVLAMLRDRTRGSTPHQPDAE